MRSKITLVLLFLNVVLFFYIFRFERNWRTEAESFEARRRVLGPEAADIRRLEVSSQTPGASYSLERRGDAWFLTHPIEWPANPNAVSRILNELQLLEHVTSFGTADLAKNGQSLADYGLDQPKLTVTFTSGQTGASALTGGGSTVLRIGDAPRVGDLLYLLSPDGKRIHVVSRGLAESLTVPVDQLRADTVFDIPVFEARTLTIQTAAPSGERSPSVRLSRDGSKWKFDTPVLALASKNDTEVAINDLDGLRAKSFPLGYSGAPPSSAPAIRVTLGGNNRDETLYIGAKTGAGDDRYAQLNDRPAVFTVSISAKLMEILGNAPDKLRDPHVLDFDPHAVTAVTLSAPNQPEVALQRLEAPVGADEGARWQIVRRGGGDQGPQTLPADLAAVQRLLEQLKLLTAVRFQSDAPSTADLADWGLDGPEREVALTLDGTPPAQVTLQIGRPSTPASRREPYVYARVAGTSSVYAVDADILRETLVSPLDWRDRLVRSLPASARITALALTGAADASDFYSRKLADGETWETALASEPAPRKAAVLAILDQLKNLHAKTFFQDGFPDKLFVADETRTWRFKLDATVSLPAGAGPGRTETETLWITERIGGTRQLAGAKELGAVFEIEQPLVDALWTLTYGPRDPGPPPAKSP
jgi:Domain of unknown function (DUF4340)